MKAERNFPKFIITAKGTRWVEQGHPWIYEGEVVREEGQCENGCLAVDYDSTGIRQEEIRQKIQELGFLVRTDD